MTDRSDPGGSDALNPATVGMPSQKIRRCQYESKKRNKVYCLLACGD
jgi:hypothetical protein